MQRRYFASAGGVLGGLGPEITMEYLNGSGVYARDVAKARDLERGTGRDDEGQVVERARGALSKSPYSGRRPKSPRGTLATAHCQGCARTRFTLDARLLFLKRLATQTSFLHNFSSAFPYCL